MLRSLTYVNDGVHSRDTLLDGRQAGSECGGKARLLQYWWRTQLEDEEPHVAKSILRSVSNIAKMPTRECLVTCLKHPCPGLGIERDAVECLSNRVMQLSGEAIAFSKRGRLLGLFVQSRILDSYGGLVCKREG